jgi:hypothetical protein
MRCRTVSSDSKESLTQGWIYEYIQHFSAKMTFFFKIGVMIQLCKKLAVFWTFFSNFFVRENFLKIITSVPGIPNFYLLFCDTVPHRFLLQTGSHTSTITRHHCHHFPTSS